MLLLHHLELSSHVSWYHASIFAHEISSLHSGSLLTLMLRQNSLLSCARYSLLLSKLAALWSDKSLFALFLLANESLVLDEELFKVVCQSHEAAHQTVDSRLKCLLVLLRCVDNPITAEHRLFGFWGGLHCAQGHLNFFSVILDLGQPVLDLDVKARNLFSFWGKQRSVLFY